MDKDRLDKDARLYLESLKTEASELPIDERCCEPMELPPWYDKKLFKRAQEYYMENIFAMFAGKLAGLIAVLSVPSILDVLIYTKQSSTRITSYKRYIATIFHSQTWYEHDLVPGSKSWKSLEAVRKMHLAASRRAKNGEIGFISQKDMALTQFGFMGFITIKPELLGIQVTLEKHEAFIHFWRVIGHLVGIEDRFNLCTDSWKRSKGRIELVESEIFKPLLENPSTSFKEMATVLLEAMWCFNPLISVDAFLYFTRFLSNCDGYIYYGSSKTNLETKQSHMENIESLDWYGRLILCLQILLHTVLLNFTYLRWYFNSQIHISTYLIKYFPFLAFWSIGIQHSYVRILNCVK